MVAVLMASGCTQPGQPGNGAHDGLPGADVSGGQQATETGPILTAPREGWYCGSFKLDSDIVNSRMDTAVEAARQAGFSFVGMVINSSREGADLHLDSCRQATGAGFLCIPCQVVGNCEGWLVAIGLEGPIDANQSLDGMIDFIHTEGGVAYITHPMQDGNCSEWRRWDISTMDGLAVVSPMSQTMQDDEKAIDEWHVFLNNGYRMHAFGETDTKPFTSTYALSNMLDSSYQCLHIEGNLTRESVIDALLSGSFYVTNGPVLNFTVNGHGLGKMFNVTYGEEVNISLDVSSADAFSKVRIIRNGVVIQEIGKSLNRYTANMTSIIARDTWFSVDVWGGDYTPEYHDFIHAIANPVWVHLAE